MQYDALNEPASNYEMLGVQWLVPGWLALGEVHVFAGASKTGKSLALTTVAAAVTRGGQFFDGQDIPKRRVAFYSTEEDYASALIPRFVAADGDQTMLHIGSSHYDVARHLEEVAPSLAKLPEPVGLIVIDGVGSAVDNMSDNSEVRRYLNAARQVAIETGAALVFITHTPKGATQKYTSPQEFVLGAQAWVAVPRMAIVMVPDKQVKEAKATMMVRFGNLPHSKDGAIRLFLDGVVSLGHDRRGVEIVADKLDLDKTEVLEGDPSALFAAANDPKVPMPKTKKNLKEIELARDELTRLIAAEENWVRYTLDLQPKMTPASPTVFKAALDDCVKAGICNVQKGLHKSKNTTWVARADVPLNVLGDFGDATWAVDAAELNAEAAKEQD